MYYLWGAGGPRRACVCVCVRLSLFLYSFVRVFICVLVCIFVKLCVSLDVFLCVFVFVSLVSLQYHFGRGPLWESTVAPAHILATTQAGEL